MYVRGLTDSLDVQVTDGAVEVAQDLAGKPGDDLNRRAANRELTTYAGGAFTAGEYLDFIRGLPSNQRSRLATAEDEEIENLLQFYTRNEILVAEARNQGIETNPTQADSMRRTARAQLRGAASAAGLLDVAPQEGETLELAIDRKVMAFLQGIIAGEQKDTLSTVLGAIAVAASMTNIVSGFLITDRMLKMFREKGSRQ